MAFADRLAFQNELQDMDGRTTRADRAPTERQRLGRLAISSFMLNRTIGSGIFIKPGTMLQLTGSISVTIILWVVAGIFALSATYVWLELGLSTPRHKINGEEEDVSVPRNGGEKNYLEFVYRNPELLTTCLYGIMFIILGNVAGNAYAFAIYLMGAATGVPYSDDQKPIIIGIAFGALTLVVLIHFFTRSGGIWLNHCFTVVKTALILGIIVLGIIKASGDRLGGPPNALDNFNNSFSQSGVRTTPTGVANALLGAIYSFSGFLQPFYLLSEFRTPRKRFPRYTLSTVVLITVLFLMVNVSFFMVVEKRIILNSDNNIATLFFEHVFGSHKAFQAMSALLAVSVLGNVVVMTYAAARVKQEIAKEGILPFSLFWGTGHTSPAAKLFTSFQRNVLHRAPERAAGYDTSQDLDHQEQTPGAALLLHWFFSVVLIAATVKLTPQSAYELLTNLYTYTCRVMVDFFVGAGLIILRLSPSRDWKNKTHFSTVPTWLSLIPACIVCGICGFLAVVNFIKPPILPSYSPYYIVPVIGITSPLWGLAWFACLQLYMKLGHKILKVSRVPYVVPEAHMQGKYLQAAEVIDHEWIPDVPERISIQEQGKVPYVEEYEVGPRHRYPY